MTALELHRANARPVDDRPDSPCAALAALLAEAQADRVHMLAMLGKIAALIEELYGAVGIELDPETHQAFAAIIARAEGRTLDQ